MLKAIILLGVSCPSAWALPTANIQKTLSSDAHNQNIASSGTHDQKTLGQKTLSEDSHHQKIDDWTKTESETALLDARRKRFNVVSGCECQHDDWSTPDDEWSKECDQIANCGATVERTRTKKWCKKYDGPCEDITEEQTCNACPPPSSPPSTPPTDWGKTTSGPIAWGHSGGGTRAFFSAMAIARAMVADGLEDVDNADNEPGLLGKLDYIGSISGSSWFTNLLGYDEAFFNQIKETSKPIGQVVSEFGDRWEQKMSDEHDSWRASDSFADRAESISQFITFGSGFDTMEINWDGHWTGLGVKAIVNIGKKLWNGVLYVTKSMIDELSYRIETAGGYGAETIDFMQHFQTKLPIDRNWQRFVEHYILGGAGTNDPGRFDANNVERNGLKTTKLITLVTVPPDVFVEAPTKAQVSSAAAVQLELLQTEMLQKLNHSMHQSLQKANDEELLGVMIISAATAAAAAAAVAAPGSKWAKYLTGKALNEVMEWLGRQVPLPAAWFDGLENSQSACSDVMFSDGIDVWREIKQLKQDLDAIGADESHPANRDVWEKLVVSGGFLKRFGFLAGYGQQTSTLKISPRAGASAADLLEFQNMKAALPMAWVVEKKEAGGNVGDAIAAVPVTTDTARASYFIASDMVDIDNLSAEFSCNAEPTNIKATKKLDIPTLGTHPPKVGTMSAGSSSAMGFLISPQMVETNNGVGLQMLTAKLGHMGHLLGTSLKGQRGVPADDEANKAQPGLIKFMGPSLYGHDEDRADYRMIDGCFVDNSGIAFTVATMQKDAIALGTADKSGPKRMRLIGTSYSAKNDDDTVMQVLFANPQHDTTGVSWLAEKFGNPEGNAAFRKWQTSAKDRGIDLSQLKGGRIGPTSSNGGAVGSAPLPQVFAERYPEAKCADGEHEACWTDLDTGRITGQFRGNGWYPRGTEDSQTRGYWSTLLHTVDNSWWNIEGDWEIDVLMLQPQCNVKTTAWPADQYKLLNVQHEIGQVSKDANGNTVYTNLNEDGVYFRQIECAEKAYDAYTQAGIFKKFFHGGSKCVNGEVPGDALCEQKLFTPEKKDMCSCTGSGNQIHCSETGNTYCGSHQACYAPMSEQREFGERSSLCRTKDRCSCTGKGNQFRCDSGIRYCGGNQDCYAPPSEDFGFGEWGSLCRDK